MTDDLKSHIEKLDIQELRMANGDHIIAEVLWDRDSDDIVIKDPILVNNSPNGKSFTEWFTFTDTQYFSIDKSSVIASGTVAFTAKVFFCRLVLTRNIKTNLLSGNPQSEEDIDLLKEIAVMMDKGESLFISDAENELADEQIEKLYANWGDDVDTSKVH